LQDNSWGEFLPVRLSPFCYNESLASEELPVEKSKVLERGWKWQEDEERTNQTIGSTYVIPESIADVSDDITKEILTCTATGQPYKITPQELEFYRSMNIPVPRMSPRTRHKHRMALRNPHKLWNRACAKCQKPISTSYSPERPEIVYCEECYLKEVY
jgi:hypothetical protein